MAHEWTQEQLAEKVGIGASYLARIEAGQRKATLDTLDRIARALRLSIGKLVAEEAESIDMRARAAFRVLEESARELDAQDLKLLSRIADRLHQYGDRSRHD